MLRRPVRRAAILPGALVLLAAACGPLTSSSPTPVPGASVPASLGPLGQVDTAAIRSQLEALGTIADQNGGVRTAGTPGYAASVDHVAGRLRDLGYAVQTPSFEMATFEELPGATIRVAGGPTFAAGLDFRAMIYSASGDLRARIVEVGEGADQSGGCATSEFDDFPRGAIALTPPGPCFRRDAVQNAAAAGAVALIVSYPQWATGAVRRPTLLSPEGISIPALSASAEVGDALRAAAVSRREVTISVHTAIGSAMVQNVIAESHAVAAHVVMLGGHLDSVHDGPGINDNGSGVAALLDVARVLAEQHPSARVRFAFWAGEEFGILGSRAYTEGLRPAERAEISAYLNFDMLGSRNAVPLVYDAPSAALGSERITDFLVSYLEDAGVGAEPTDIGAASDHAAFDAIGIPTGGIFSGASEVKTAEQAARFGGTAQAPMDACYHLACDTVANVDVDLVATFAQAALALAVAIASGQLPLT
jgi:Zn-dependent M28 family amino/carboxypeptidase